MRLRGKKRPYVKNVISKKCIDACIHVVVICVHMAAASDDIHIRLPRKLKRSAQKVIERNGLDVTSAIRLFFTHITIRDTIPLTFLTSSGLPKDVEEGLLEQLNKKDFRGPFKDAKSAIRALHEDPL